MKKVVLATGNPGKVNELSELLKAFKFDILAQTDLGITSIEETGLTFIENAILKARHAAKATGLPAIAEDSGISVHALKGAPGIYSARYSGPYGSDQDNIKKLLTEMKDIPDHDRQAQFDCLLVYLRHPEDSTPLICHGIWKGVVRREAKGNNGFGYDPIFYDPQLGLTAAELTKEKKNIVSHRGQALRILLESLRNG
ncbi:RdgB/HAM1 family non-canonical purine NTP pyrophosphatase [Cardinium endosymbiont of Bemisia tabaci]|uniref:RdgB/HAM1 family non-canonical purine NTP pyrophosphatase n=1 Tax=Cardinium endosymbiont of Bemisia tabaci TaxID=672794 RepID=UPI000442D254|nr:RdgB/HAM1 family non-canonical purine NTP pyrophosphatase [Cardinium endosymbiont of Bemisia tabaci]CDG49957.1 dITP/XTP pyrophosphatase [Cardinium endosymbiont cBtQ1 of Bemisia tabaci]